MPPASPPLIAVDIGNSRIKLGRFGAWPDDAPLPAPIEALELPLVDRSGRFESEPLDAWGARHAGPGMRWRVSSVHRGATQRLEGAVKQLGRELGRDWTWHQVALADVPLAVEVDAPEKVGMDRLMGAVAADRLRAAERGAIVADLGTALKLQVVNEAGAFVGGAIMPGLEMAARALHEQTDALPRVEVERWSAPPMPLGKATVPAIESGLFWGAVGAIRELVARLAADWPTPPEVFVTGGGSPLVAQVLSDDERLAVRHVPHLVLSGIAALEASRAGRAGG